MNLDGWSKNVCFCPRSGYKNCPRRGGGAGVKKWQNSVHVVVECPQRVIKNEKFHFRTPSTKSEIALAKEDASGYLAR